MTDINVMHTPNGDVLARVDDFSLSRENVCEFICSCGKKHRWDIDIGASGCDCGRIYSVDVKVRILNWEQMIKEEEIANKRKGKR